MKTILVSLLAIMLSVLSINAQTVELVWETDTLLNVPESVLFADTVLYVSNVNGSPTEKNGKGFISKVSLKGEILHKEWATGLNAPKGMGAYGGYIFVSDIDKVAVIDISTGKLVNTYEFKEAEFLNDVTVDSKGKVYISDMNANAIYVIQEDFSKILIQDNRLDHVNGLYWDNGLLLAGTNDGVFKIDNSGKILEHYIKDTGGIDGLERINSQYFLISDWVGKVHLISKDNDPILLLNFESDKYNAADLGYNKADKIFYVPSFFGNTVAAYRVNIK